MSTTRAKKVLALSVSLVLVGAYVAHRVVRANEAAATPVPTPADPLADAAARAAAERAKREAERKEQEDMVRMYSSKSAPIFTEGFAPPASGEGGGK